MPLLAAVAATLALCAGRLVSAQTAQLETVYAFWDTPNQQHTFHFPPAWNGETQGSLAFYAHRSQHTGTEPVRDFWDNANRQHTFHFAPAWTHGGQSETQGDIQFYAHRHKIHAGLMPVYDWWDGANGQHTFHFAPAWTHGGQNETQGGIQFYAWRNLHRAPEEDFEPVDGGAGRACRGANEGDNLAAHYLEHAGKPLLAACKELCVMNVNCTGIAHHPSNDGGRCEVWTRSEGIGATAAVANYTCLRYAPRNPTSYMSALVKPVHVFWDTVNSQHTFHAPPAWPNEAQFELQFFAPVAAHPGAMPVYDFWDSMNAQHTFHFAPAWNHSNVPEVQGDLQFYAFPNATHETLEPVYDFWDSVNRQHTFHFAPAWANEVQNGIQFYAWRNESAALLALQTSTLTATTTRTFIMAQMVTSSVRMEGNYDEVVGNRKQEFLDNCTANLQPVQCVNVRPGSIIVDLMGAQSQLVAVVQQIRDVGLNLTGFASLVAAPVLNGTNTATTDNNTNITNITNDTMDAFAVRSTGLGGCFGVMALLTLLTPY